MSEALRARVGASLDRQVNPAVAAFAHRLAQEAGALAVLFYGSNLRTGSLDGVLDFYLLLPGRAERGMWPRVSYREWTWEGQDLRAKIASMTLAKFAQAARGETRDTTIWARFVQPGALIWARSDTDRAQVIAAICAAAETAARLAVAVGPDAGPEDEFWKALFRATYKAELRVEPPGRENSIIEANAAHFDGLLPAALSAQNIAFGWDRGRITPAVTDEARRDILRWWRRRQRLGKPINVARLLRATMTFDGAARYGAWKLHRHTGIEVRMTPWREKHPLLAAPGAAWEIWRARRRGPDRDG